MLLILFLFFSVLNAQEIRTAGMGGIGYSVADEDNSLTPYDFGSNPAWLVNDQKQDWLKIVPSSVNSWGDYKRVYDPERNNVYNILFRGVKVLENGTFLGETTYEYDYRKSVSHSLKYKPYNGEAFFMNDSTTGNFRYHGPSMKFMYSFEPVDNLYAGASASYKLLSGLKNIYSRAETLYRNVSADAGIVYRINDNLLAGATISYISEQEKIVSDADNLLDVDIYNYMGDTFYTLRRAASVSDKFKNNTTGAGVQLYYRPSEKVEIAFSGDAKQASGKLLIPYSSTDVTYSEYERGYASLSNYDALAAARYYVNEDVIVSASAGYHERKSWSKNTALDLLLWEWNIKGLTAGAGTSFKISEDILAAVEYEYSSEKIDSSKYVDSRYYSKKEPNHLVKIGFEAELIKNIYLRAGFNYGTSGVDLLFGGEDVKYYRITCGAGIYTFKTFGIDLLITYNSYKPGDYDVVRSGLSSYIVLKLLSF